MRKAAIVAVLVSFGAAGAIYGGNDVLISFESDRPSESIGSTNSWHLVSGKRLPSSGPNFRTYSRLASLVGRTAVHNRVRNTILSAYKTLEEEHPELVFVYGETGWPSGGRFRPHRTHQNGLSVDFMVPVMKGAHIVPLPTHPLNRWGYSVSFDEEGRSGDLQIDFEAMALHLQALIAAGRTHGVSIELVVFAPDLQRHLFNSELDVELLEEVRFNVNPSWVRHDDHYHVDFQLEAVDEG